MEDEQSPLQEEQATEKPVPFPKKEKGEAPSLQVWQSDVIIQQEKVIRRLSYKSLLMDLASVFNLEKGLSYTFWGLTTRPAQTIREYLDIGRNIVLSPIKYFILIVGTTLFIASQNGFFLKQQSFKKGLEWGMKSETDVAMDPKKQEFFDTILQVYIDYYVNYQNVWFIITILFTSWLTYLFFKKSKYNFIEHNVINTYIFVHTYILFTIIVIINTTNDIWYNLYLAVYLLMSLIVYKRLFYFSWWGTFWRTFMAFVFSMIMFMVFIGVITLGIAVQILTS